ncbi:MAG: hypothetical protein SFV52_05990 [Saprospiraceae bacterium]|nr:hypothetical protein [Saprospiraceae bacterium]
MMRNQSFDWISDLQPAHLMAETWQRGEYLDPAVVHVTYDHNGPFSIACGAELLANQIRRFRFTPDIIKRLGQTTDHMGRCVFNESFLNFLQRLRLRVDIIAAPEGSVLLPEEPVLIARGPLAHLQLLESAFRHLIWKSTHWATEAALERWHSGNLHEEESPPAPRPGDYPQAWQARAAFIGGATPVDLQQTAASVDTPPPPDVSYEVITHPNGDPLVQIRRLYRDSVALGDAWLTAKTETAASVSRSTCTFVNMRNGKEISLHFTRFKNLYEPLLAKGHPVLYSPHPGYFRQRTLQHLTALREIGPGEYPYGWMAFKSPS